MDEWVKYGFSFGVMWNVKYISFSYTLQIHVIIFLLNFFIDIHSGALYLPHVCRLLNMNIYIVIARYKLWISATWTAYMHYNIFHDLWNKW